MAGWKLLELTATLRRPLRVVLCCIGFLWEPGASATNPKESESYVINPTGTFLKWQSGRFLFFEGVDILGELGLSVQNGVYAGVSGLLTTPVAAYTIGLLPTYLSAGPIGFLLLLSWKFHTPISHWWLYVRGLRGLWNYRGWRVGRVPVYLSSPVLSRQLLVSFRYPMATEHVPHLEIVRLPESFAQAVTKQNEQEDSSSAMIKAWHNLSAAMVEKQLVRISVSVNPHNLVLSVQRQDGRWVYRDLVRPLSLLLVESIYAWSNRKQISSARSLLTPEVLNYLAEALSCRDRSAQVWLVEQVKIAEDESMSLFEVARKGEVCDQLEVVDTSRRWGGFGGYLNLRMGQSCDTDNLFQNGVISHMTEEQLIAKLPVQIVPYWLNRLMAEVFSESVAVGTQVAVNGLWSLGSESSGQSVAHETTVAEEVESKILLCLSLGRPDAGSPVPSNSSRICGWRLRRGD